jgi:hypothetical protein
MLPVGNVALCGRGTSSLRTPFLASLKNAEAPFERPQPSTRTNWARQRLVNFERSRPWVNAEHAIANCLEIMPIALKS